MRGWQNMVSTILLLMLVGCAPAAPTSQPEMTTVAPSPTDEPSAGPTSETPTSVPFTPELETEQPDNLPTLTATSAPTLIPAPPLSEDGALVIFEASRSDDWFSL